MLLVSSKVETSWKWITWSGLCTIWVHNVLHILSFGVFCSGIIIKKYFFCPESAEIKTKQKPKSTRTLFRCLVAKTHIHNSSQLNRKIQNSVNDKRWEMRINSHTRINDNFSNNWAMLHHNSVWVNSRACKKKKSYLFNWTPRSG